MIDYWTYGCILYEMLSGHPPFVHKNQITLFEMIKSVVAAHLRATTLTATSKTELLET
jgi:serine/threonine protein kinase